MVVTLDAPVDIVIPSQVIRPVQLSSTGVLTIVRYVDLPQEKIVRVFTEEVRMPIVLWSGDGYDAIGQWTDADVTARLKALAVAGTLLTNS